MSTQNDPNVEAHSDMKLGITIEFKNMQNKFGYM